MKRPTCQHPGCGRALARGTKGIFCLAHRYVQDRGGAPHAGEATKTFKVDGDTASGYVMVPRKPRTLAELLVDFEIDGREWAVKTWEAGEYELGTKHPTTGEVTVTKLWRINARFVRRLEVIRVTDDITAIVADAKAAMPARVLPRTKARKDGVALEIEAPDLHLGKLAWAKETGWEDYDLAIAERCYLQAVESLLDRTSSFTVSEILLPIGSDMINTDNKMGMTTRGTPQDVDSRFQKSYATASRLTRRIIDRCLEVAPVKVKPVPGNHDELATWTLGHAIELYYTKAKHVVIDNDPTLRKYWEWGQVMLMLAHGDKIKARDWPGLMAAEQRAMFGRTRFHEIHCGHLHTTRLQEWNGVRVRVFPSLCAPEAWHSAHGYVGNLRQAVALVWDKTEGQIGEATFTLPE